MNILVFPLSYPNEINKTANIFTKEQVDELSKTNKVVVAFIQLLPTRMLFKKKQKEIIDYYDGDVHIYKIQMHTFLESKFPKINGWFYKRKAYKLLNKVRKENKVDCIYAHFSIYAGWASVLYGLKNHIPVVVQEHDGKLIGHKIDNVRKKMVSTVCEFATNIICVSDNLRKHMEFFSGIKRKYIVIGNIVPSRFSFYPKVKKDHFVFLCVANLYKGKNIDILVDAFCKTFSIDDSVVLRICGDGDCRSFLETMIRNKNRASQIKICGRLSRDELLREYIDCDCFVLPSDHETFGIVYREAMAVGRPIISTNHGGFNDGEVGEENGIIVSLNDESLKNAMKYMFHNIDKYDSKKISAMCIDNFGKDIVISKINQVLKDSIKN